MPEVFDLRKDNWATERAELRELLSDDAYKAAALTTINAHFTDLAYVREIWAGMERLGFTGGRVLEPGAGAGAFIGLAPSTADMIGVELDPTTAAIAKGLYPQADIRTESFVETKLPGPLVDAVVGNVPFGDTPLHDPVHNPDRRHSMHNHFILKSLALTRPGGMVAVLSSSFTLDAANPAARQEMNQLADLVGAVRLPTGAHRRAAGTEVVTDLLVFRRREPGTPPRDDTWESVTARRVDGETVHVNAYFDTRPENIIGDLHAGQGMYGGATLHVTTDLDTVPSRLRQAIDGIVVDATTHDQLMTVPTTPAAVDATPRPAADADLWAGTIVVDGEGFVTVDDGHLEPLKVAKKNTRELRQLLDLRDQVKALLEQEASTVEDTNEIEDARAKLRTDYRSYANQYGPINRYTYATNGARITPEAPRKMLQDPFGPPVLALELFDDEEQTVVEAAVLSGRVITPRPLKDGTDSPAEAITLSMERHGTVRLDTVASLLGTDQADARAQLGELVYDDPEDATQIIPAAEYLSGNIVERLDTARAAAETNPQFQVNVAALEAVLPAPMLPEEIEARIGAVWIDQATHQQFFRDLLRSNRLNVTSPLPGTWEVTGGVRTGVLSTETWGTEQKPAHELIKSILNQTPIKVERDIEMGDKTQKVVDPEATAAAVAKAEEIQERFAEWVWEDPERSERLQAEYNRRLNSIVLRNYDRAGDYLTFPGMVEGWTPMPHQRAAVARIISEPAVGLFHQVGAGKTAEMVMGAMELKRMGLISKPAVVVPNHMLKQFAREWLQIYPQARILAAGTSDLQKDKRRLFVARAAANDWDAVILTQTAFQSLPLSAAATEEYLHTELSGYEDALVTAQEAGADGASVKKIQKAILNRTEALKSQADMTRDVGISFEHTGIDYLFVDEAHLYKSLFTPTAHDVNPNPAKKATDLHMKLGLLRQRNGNRVGTLATATPLANSIVEAYTTQRYLRPDLLHAAGIRTFDEWAATFATTSSDVEITVAGKLTMKTRLAKFQNVPEMLRMWHVSADVKTQEDLKLPVPDIAVREDGRRLPVTHTIAPSPQLVEFFEHLAERADNAKGKRAEKGADNMLAIATDGRKAAVDAQLAGLPEETTGITKADVIAENVHRIWERTRDDEYVSPESGDPSPVRGALQLVFSDYGTPTTDGSYSIYHDLKAKLVARGMDPASIRFMHDARNDREKDQLFSAARAGHIAVLIGSTGKMGMGTNVQARAVALHHVDCPWRPADVEQRDGRIIRKGNQNTEVEMHRYVVQRSFDAFMWQTVERKARFIAQVMRGSLDTREIEDIGDATISAAETKAIATGNPLLLDQVQTNDELQKLRRLERAHNRSQSNLVRSHEYAQRRTVILTRDIQQLERAAGTVISTTGEEFTLHVNGDGGYGRSWNRYDKRADAAHAIVNWAQQARLDSRNYSSSFGQVAKVGAFTINAELVTAPGTALSDGTVKFTIDGLPDAEVTTTRRDVLTGSLGVITKLENLQASIPTLLERTRERLTETELNLADANQRIGLPFKHSEQLTAVQARAAKISAQLLAEERGTDDTQSPPRPPLVEELRADSWWRDRPAAEIRDLVDGARASKGSDPAAKAVYAVLSDEIQRRYPAAVARHFGLENHTVERTRPDSPSNTGPTQSPRSDTTVPSLS